MYRTTPHVCRPYCTPAQDAEEEHALMRRVAARDREAFEQLYQRYARRLLGYLMRRLPQRELAEEVLNDVLLELWRQAPQYEARGPLAAWLFGIARRLASMAFRSTRPRPLPAPEPPDWDGVEDPETGLARQQLCRAVVQALASLPAAQRQVVELAYYHGLSYQEIATLVGCPVNTVKTRMARARERLVPQLTTLGLVSTLPDWLQIPH